MKDKCSADLYALYCDECQSHPSNCKKKKQYDSISIEGYRSIYDAGWWQGYIVGTVIGVVVMLTIAILLEKFGGLR